MQEEIATVSDIRNIFDTIAPLTPAAPVDLIDVSNRVSQANAILENEGYQNPDLLHSSIIVFQQQRYYDVTRLYLHTENVYENLTAIVNNATNINDSIKKALAPFGDVAFPRTISVDEPPSAIKISLFDKKAYLEVEIIISYFSGKTLKYLTQFQY